jgi:glycosyltransferase involved in cell wall biosynthesis
MRIGFFTPTYPGVSGDGGIGTYTRDLAHGLSRLGVRVHVVTPSDGPAVEDGPVSVFTCRADHLPLIDRILPGAGSCWRVGRAVRRVARDKKLDLVEFPNWDGLGLAYQGLGPTATVVRLHTSAKETQVIDGLPDSRRLRWDVRRERWQARRAAALVTHSAAHRRAMAEEVGVPEEQIEVIPHGVPVFPEWVRPPQSAGPPTVVFLGRMERRKGTPDLLQAVPRVLDAVPDARFVLIGSDRPHCPGGRTHAAYLRDEFPAAVRERVTLAGRLPQADVDRWLQAADVFVAPSLYESFGLVFPEAMRWGTPVVGTTAGGIPEVVTDGETGLLVPPGDAAALGAALVRLLRDEALRNRLGAAGRAAVEKRFSSDRMAADAAGFYERVIRRTAGRAP